MLELIYLMFPAYVANMVPVLVRRISWDCPMDFNLKFAGKRVLGSHKTWKGFLFGIVGALLTGFFMQLYWPFDFSVFLWSFLVGFGALFGDCVKSFFKRRLNIKPGSSWIPFDQVDYSVGALFCGSFIYFPGWWQSFFIVIVSFVLHILINHLAFFLRIRNEKW